MMTMARGLRVRGLLPTMTSARAPERLVRLAGVHAATDDSAREAGSRPAHAPACGRYHRSIPRHAMADRSQPREVFMQVIAICSPSRPDWRWRIVDYLGQSVEESDLIFASIEGAVAAGKERLDAMALRDTPMPARAPLRTRWTSARRP
jgi:hypothetical protein